MKYIFSKAQKLEMLKCAHEVDKLVQLFKKVHGTLVFSSSLPPIGWSSREGGDSVGHHGRVPPLEQHPEPRPGVADRFSLLLPIMPRQGPSKLPHLVHSNFMPAPKCLGS